MWQDTAGFLARLKKNNVGKASYSQLRLILGDGGEGLGQLTGIDLTQPDDGRWRCWWCSKIVTWSQYHHQACWGQSDHGRFGLDLAPARVQLGGRVHRDGKRKWWVYHRWRPMTILWLLSHLLMKTNYNYMRANSPLLQVLPGWPIMDICFWKMVNIKYGKYLNMYSIPT